MRWSGGTNRKIRPFDPAFRFKVSHNLLHFCNIMNSIPKQTLACTREAAICTLEMPSTVFVFSMSNPKELAVVFLDSVENVVKNVIESSSTRGKKFCHDWYLPFGMAYYGDNVEGFIAIYSVRCFLQVVEYTSYTLVSRE